jgi:carboxyl-terminal processing protease
LTTSKYFTPSGASIHEKGIEPDIAVKRILPKEESEEKEEKEKEKEEKDSDKLFEDVELRDTNDPDKLKQTKEEDKVKKMLLEDNQVQTAISVIKGIRVFKSFESKPST